MPNKRASRNAYFFFTLDMIPVLRQRGVKVSGVREAIPLCSGDWALLSPEEKEKYSEKAKAWKSQDPETPSGHDERGYCVPAHDVSPPRRLSSIPDKPKQKPQEPQRQHTEIYKKSKGLERNVIYIIDIFSHGEMPSACPQRFVPCEIGCVRYSLQDGVMDTFHNFIHPGELPYGFRYHCQAGSAATHQIPVSGFELASDDYHNLFRSFCDFACSAPGVWPILYCKNIDLYRVKWCLQWLAKKAGIADGFLLMDIESLFIKFYQEKLKEEPSRSSISRRLETVKWDYARNTRCKWHEENDMWYCALASCKKITYCMSNALASIYNIVLTPAHLPDLEPQDKQKSDNAKTIILDAKRYQKTNTEKPHLCERSSVYAHDTSPQMPRGMIPSTPSLGRGRGILRLLADMAVDMPASFTARK